MLSLKTKVEKSIIILSGGIDSSTLLFYLVNLKKYKVIHGITFIYGQKHHKEIEFAKKIAQRFYNLEHILVDLTSLKTILRSALTCTYSKPTVVPNRNAVFLSIAVGYAESIGADSIFYGAHHSDRGTYPDCRREFVESFQKTAKLGTGNMSLDVETPFINMTKAEIISLGNRLNVPYDLTWSCYQGKEKHCGICGSCRERKIAFANAGIKDPTIYEQ
jgi:7-cyano-7-deazaguanine synthase